MELNVEQIKKALECCLVESNCTDCPLRHQYETDCLKYAGKKALSLIKELTEENGKLKDERDRYKRYYFNHDYDRMEAMIKAETVSEMQEKVNAKILEINYILQGLLPFIDQIAKEVLAGANTNGN